MENNNSLEKLRKDLDDTDDKLLELLTKRFKLIFAIGQYKKENCIPMMQDQRVEFVINKAKTVAKNNNLNSEFFNKIYKTIIDIACDIEDEIIDG